MDVEADTVKVHVDWSAFKGTNDEAAVYYTRMLKQKMAKYKNIRKVESCTKGYGQQYSGTFPFPSWMLFVLTPMTGRLEIGEIVVYPVDSDPSFIPESTEGQLQIERLVCVSSCNMYTYENELDTLMSRFLKFLSQYSSCISFSRLDVKVFVNPCSMSEHNDECACCQSVVNLKCSLQNMNQMNEINNIKVILNNFNSNSSPKIEMFENDEYIPQLIEAYDTCTSNSNLDYSHVMCTFKEKESCEKDDLLNDLDDTEVHLNPTLIAVLGYGSESEKVFAYKSYVSDVSVIESSSHMNYIFKNMSRFKLVFCQTACDDGTIVNGATALAIQWLQEEWKKSWHNDFKSLVVLIPYGGTYREDEMIVIHEATDDGIIIVCAAGPTKNGEVAFPAALGNVISVGTAGTNGPRGREIDICMSGSSSGLAATQVACYISHFLIRLHKAVQLFTTSGGTEGFLFRAVASSISNMKECFHTCIIRELILSEATGSHDSQVGYGNGKDIFKKLILDVSAEKLIKKLADILLKILSKKIYNGITDINHDGPSEVLFSDLDGDGVSVAVVDIDFPTPKNRNIHMGESHKTDLVEFLKPSATKHGERCSIAVHNICPSATILCVRVINSEENGLTFGFRDCCSHDINDKQIDIIACSSAQHLFNLELCKAVSEAIKKGIIIVFAAGNEGQQSQNTVGYPGRIGNVLVVGGCDQYNNPINYSSIGRELDFLAHPTVGAGTSLAAPVVAGYIALLLEFIDTRMEHDHITAWSKPPGKEKYEWMKIPISKAARNVYAMRYLLRKTMVAKAVQGMHSEKEGFGCVDFSVLFPKYKIQDSDKFVAEQAKLEIHRTLQEFYKC